MPAAGLTLLAPGASTALIIRFVGRGFLPLCPSPTLPPLAAGLIILRRAAVLGRQRRVRVLVNPG
jgi:hypothetical protein